MCVCFSVFACVLGCRVGNRHKKEFLPQNSQEVAARAEVKTTFLPRQNPLEVLPLDAKKNNRCTMAEGLKPT